MPSCPRTPNDVCILVEARLDADFTLDALGRVLDPDAASTAITGTITGQPLSIEAAGIVGTFTANAGYRIPGVPLAPGTNIIEVRATWSDGTRARDLIVSRGPMPSMRLVLSIDGDFPLGFSAYQRIAVAQWGTAGVTEQDLVGAGDGHPFGYGYGLLDAAGVELFRAAIPDTPFILTTEGGGCGDFLMAGEAPITLPILPSSSSIVFYSRTGYGLGAEPL